MSGWNRNDVDELHRLHDSLRADERALSTHVAFCRQNGMPWQTIADALGVSKQAAHRKYRSTRTALEDQAMIDAKNLATVAIAKRLAR